MHGNWLTQLNTDPRPSLLNAGDKALTYFVQHELQDNKLLGNEQLWELPEPGKLVRKQQPDGRWKYASKSIDPQTSQNYDLLETYRNLAILVEMYAFDRGHPAIELAAEYLFSCQREEGDIRGILGNQHMPYYHGAILELLIKAGFRDDPRTLKGLRWLLDMRQDDGGWIVPMQAVAPADRSPDLWRGKPVPLDRSLPHAHMATGMAIRAFAAHPEWSGKPEVVSAGAALKNRFFKPDAYNDRKAKSYWLKFKFPFWWGNLLTALDSLSLLGFTAEDAEVSAGIEWFQTNQQPDGLWSTGYGKGRKARSNLCWVGFAVCRMLRRFYK